MQTASLAKLVVQDESLPNISKKIYPSVPKFKVNDTDPIKEKVIYYESINRENRIQEKEIGWWIGYVTAIRKETFESTIEDLKGRVSIVEFENEVIDPLDRDLLFINSRFTYAITLLDKPDGREYKTKFSFSARRRWLKEYESEAKRLADQYFPDSLLCL